MGWLVKDEKLRHETPVQYITRRFSHENEHLKATVMAAASVRGTIYAATRNEDKKTGHAYVFCAVIRFFNNERDGFGYKTMDEGMGPYEVDCPDRIMRLLSPVEDIPNPSCLADWRTRVAARKAERSATRQKVGSLKPGDVIRLSRAISSRTWALPVDTFRFIGPYKRSLVFEPLPLPGLRCRLSRNTLAGATIEH